jgi:hypothetical protein
VLNLPNQLGLMRLWHELRAEGGQQQNMQVE